MTLITRSSLFDAERAPFMRGAAAAAICALALALGGCKGNTETAGPQSPTGSGSVIQIGEYGSLTGATATFGTSTDRGIELAIQKANSAGGALGKQLKVDVKDDASVTEQARTDVEALVNQRVAAVLGEVASSRSLQGAPVCQAAKIPMITPSSTNPRVTEVGNYIFRVCFIDPFQGKAIGSIGTDILHAKTAAMLYDNSQDYSKGLAKYIEQSFTSKGGKIVGRYTYSSSDSDYRSQLTSIKAEHPDVIFIPGYYNDVGIIARQARQLGINVPLVGGDGWDSPELTRIAGQSGGKNALDGCYFTDHFSPDEKSPIVQGFVNDYKAKYGARPDAMAALGYDAAGILVDSIKRAKSIEGTALRQAIADTKNYQGVTGNITIGPDRNAVKAIVVIKIVNGKFTFNSRIQP